MSKNQNLLGRTFGRWTVIAGPFHEKAAAYWGLRCACGSTGRHNSGTLRAGRTLSCGCVKRTHGMSSTKIYKVWGDMMRRCYDSKHESYPNYGGRGITVCAEWHSFEQFSTDMGPAPAGKELDREKNELGYFKGNCRWVTHQENSRNKRSNTRVTYAGREMCVAEAAELSGIEYNTLLGRLRRRPDRDPFRPVRQVNHPLHKKGPDHAN